MNKISVFVNFLIYWPVYVLEFISKANLKHAMFIGLVNEYRKVASSNTSRLEAHDGFFRLLMKGIFNPYVLWPFDKKLIS